MTEKRPPVTAFSGVVAILLGQLVPLYFLGLCLNFAWQAATAPPSRSSLGLAVASFIFAFYYPPSCLWGLGYLLLRRPGRFALALLAGIAVNIGGLFLLGQAYEGIERAFAVHLGIGWGSVALGGVALLNLLAVVIMARDAWRPLPPLSRRGWLLVSAPVVLLLGLLAITWALPRWYDTAHQAVRLEDARALSPDGQRAILASITRRPESQLTGWTAVRVADQHQLWSATVHRRFGGDHVVSWSPDGQLVALDGSDGVVDVREGASGTLVAQLRMAPVQRAGQPRVVWSADNRLLAASDFGQELWLWQLEEGGATLLRQLPKPQVGQMSFTPAGDLLLINGATLEIWEPRTGTLVSTRGLQPVPPRPPGEKVPSREGPQQAPIFSPDGRFLVLPYASGVEVFGIADWQHVHHSTTDVLAFVWFSPDGRFLAILPPGPGTITVLRSADWQQVQGIRVDGLASVGFSPDGQRMAVCLDGPRSSSSVIRKLPKRLQLWRLSDGVQLANDDLPEAEQCQPPRFSADGHTLQAVTAMHGAMHGGYGNVIIIRSFPVPRTP